MPGVNHTRTEHTVRGGVSMAQPEELVWTLRTERSKGTQEGGLGGTFQVVEGATAKTRHPGVGTLFFINWKQIKGARLALAQATFRMGSRVGEEWIAGRFHNKPGDQETSGSNGQWALWSSRLSCHFRHQMPYVKA